MIILDLETSGTDWRYHSMLSIGAIDFDNPENEFYGECTAFEGAKIEPEALAINGFTVEEITPGEKGFTLIDGSKPKMSDKELILKFMEWAKRVGDTTIGGENPSFDRDFLKATAERYSIDWTFAYRTIDLHSVAYAHMLSKGIEPPSKNNHSGLNLPKIIAYCGLPENKQAHNALEDTLFTAEAFGRIVYGQNTVSDFEAYPIPPHLNRS